MGRQVGKRVRKSVRRMSIAGRLLTCLVLLAALTGYVLWGNSAVTVTEIPVTLSDLPEAFSGYRIAQISDLHNAQFGQDNERLLDKLAQSRPDIIVLTGDLFDCNRTDVDIAAQFAAAAARMAPTYYVTGNHEAYALASYKQLKAAMQESGVHLLENSLVTLEQDGQTISLIGVHDSGFTNVQDSLTELVPQAEDCSILLAHRPELIGSYAGAGVDLVFSGHAHGGQFRLPFLGGILAPGQGLLPEYDAGLYQLQNTQLIVSRGLGNSRFPFRFNNRPEIVLAVLS